MAAQTAAQQNNKRGFSYYGAIPRGLCAPALGLSISACLTSALFASFSSKEDENGKVRPFNGTRKIIQELVGGSLSTISRSITQLKNKDLVTRKGMSSYVFEGETGNGQKWSFPFEICTRIFKMVDDDDKVFYRTLPPGARLVYAYYYTKLAYVTYKTTIEATFDEIAEELGIDPSTVSDAMKLLRWAKLIYFPKNFVGTNRYKKSRIGLIKRWGWFRDEAKYRERNKKSKGPSDTPQKPQNAPITRDFYYGELQAAAQAKAAEALEEARSYEDFRKLDDERANLNARLRDAFIKGAAPAQQQELSRQIKGLDAQLKEELEKLGIDAARLTPEHYVRCNKCKDTGWLQNDKPCGCFKPRGAPPARGTKNNVGESNTEI